MSSPPNNNSNNNNKGQSAAVVQTILESFTRCFNPIDTDLGCTKVNGGGSSSNNSSRRSSPINHLFGHDNRGAVSRSTSSTDRKLQNAMNYDVDGKKNSSRKKKQLSAKELEERSMKRKLEIFRGASDNSKNSQGGAKKLDRTRTPPSGSSSSREPSPTSQQIATATPEQTGQLALSDDEEELIRLTQSKQRFACGMNLPSSTGRATSPISNVGSGVVNLFRQAQKGLCFATPVRTASPEDIANLSDDKLTDYEFLCRHPLAKKDIAQVSPTDTTQDLNCSYNEEETITSTLYFDQKYSHVVQTRPPMPLFQENMLSSESRTDELTNIFQRRSNPPEFVGQSPRRMNKAKSGSSSPRRSMNDKNDFRQQGSPLGKRSPKTIFTSSKGRVGSPSKSKGHYKEPPSPIKLGDDSLSMNTSEEESMVLSNSFVEDVKPSSARKYSSNLAEF